ncbi:MAG: N-6 DNA methylase [Ktedonobacteraceae bacterium]
MQQPGPAIELPRFTNIAAVALRLAQAYARWRDPNSGEDAFTYFNRQSRQTGNEYGLRATLIRELILPIFGYEPAQIEYESQERYDLTLWSKNRQHRRRIAIIETKSPAQRDLTARQKGRESPIEQLERYLSQAGLYLGVLTNGDEWHLFDFALGSEPLASFSLLELATLLKDVQTEEQVAQLLASQPLLQQALAINFYYLDARRWEQADIFRQQIANPAYHRIASLRQAEHIELLVQQIKQVLGSLRDTIHAQFALLQQRYDEYERRCQRTGEQDKRPFAETLQESIASIVQKGAAFRFDESGMLRQSVSDLRQELSVAFLDIGDLAAFERDYFERASEILKNTQISQPTLLDQPAPQVRTVRMRPPTTGLDALTILLQTHYSYLQTLAAEYALSKKTVAAYHAWKTNVRNVFSNPRDEFCLQTAYIHFVRLFFVRVCEDHGLIPRRISNGPFARFEEYRVELLSGIKDTYLRLLEETYQRARAVYHNFYGHQELYDWFAPDEYTILSLFDLLNRYDFQDISADVLGRVYNEGYIETKERSERGQFYTPPQVVDYMLDSIGIPARDELDGLKARAFLEKSVGDLSCGSGTFLVAAATRKRATLLRLVAAREATPEYALRVLTDTFLGFDLNPFACYLAEMNLLIQCLPFLLDEQGHLCRSIKRFHIYSADSLEPTVAEQYRAVLDEQISSRFKLLPVQRGRVLSEEEQNIISIKHARGIAAELTEMHSGEQGLDYLLGNPPYVSAGESIENLRYRNTIQEYGIYQLLHQRWDLFVPFFERNLQFLRPDTGRLGLIVSNGIETEGYAEPLRQRLTSQYHLLQIDFFPGLRLFQDAAIENTVVLLENRPPSDDDTVTRRVHRQTDCTRYETLPPAPQLASNGQIFRWRYDPILDKSLSQGSIPLCAIVYVGTGIEAQSKESLDPVVRGQRQKLFTLDDVFLPPSPGQNRPPEYTDIGVLGNDVDRYFLRRKRFVAYEKYRTQLRRPRHRALFQATEKLLLGETSGGIYDRSGLFANHSVQVVVSWQALQQANALDEPGIRSVYRESREIAGAANGLAVISALFDLRYLLAIINSRFIRAFLAANRLEGTREGRIYPDVWKRLPIKIASPERQQEIAEQVDAIQSHYEQLAARPTLPSLVENPAIRLRSPEGYLAQGILRYTGDVESAIGEKPVIQEGRLILRRQPMTYLESSEPELLRYLELYLTQIDPQLQKQTWAEARTRLRVPATIAVVQAFMTETDRLATEERNIHIAIDGLSEEIETLIAAAYREPADSRMVAIIQSASQNTSIS